MIGHVVLLQKSRKHMQQWMHTVCSKYLMYFMQRQSKKVYGALKFEICKSCFCIIKPAPYICFFVPTKIVFCSKEWFGRIYVPSDVLDDFSIMSFNFHSLKPYNCKYSLL